MTNIVMLKRLLGDKTFQINLLSSIKVSSSTNPVLLKNVFTTQRVSKALSLKNSLHRSSTIAMNSLCILSLLCKMNALHAMVRSSMATLLTKIVIEHCLKLSMNILKRTPQL